MSQSALAFVGSSEYRKQAARQLAKRVAAAIDLEELIDQGEGYTDDLLDKLLKTLTPRILREAARSARTHAGTLGLLLVNDIDPVVDRALSDVLAEAMDTLGARLAELARAVERMMEAGVSEAVIAATLKSEAGATALLAPVVSVLVATGAGMVNAVEKAILEESNILTFRQAIDNGEEPPLFEWETREDDRVCDDLMENSCAPRHGEQLPLDEWEIFGTPGEAPTICTIYAKGAASNCRCVLRRAGASGSSPSPINIHEAAVNGRRRAEEDYGIAA